MRWTKNKNVIWEELEGGALLINASTGSRWTLNAAAAAAWKLCDGKRSIDGMAKALRHSHANIANLCQQFENLGLLRAEVAKGSEGATSAMFLASSQTPFHFQSAGLGTGPRRRPTPRGNSGPG